MSMAATTATATVRLKHHYNIPRERVYEAWTKVETLGQWFGPHSHRCKVEKLNVHEGGQYQIRMIPIAEDHDCQCEANADSVCAGKFLKVKAPELLMMTFNWIENGADMSETLLTIEFQEAAKGTEVLLIHERLPDEELRQAHEGGWQGTLECLEEFLGKN